MTSENVQKTIDDEIIKIQENVAEVGTEAAMDHLAQAAGRLTSLIYDDPSQAKPLPELDDESDKLERLSGFLAHLLTGRDWMDVEWQEEERFEWRVRAYKIFSFIKQQNFDGFR